MSNGWVMNVEVIPAVMPVSSVKRVTGTELLSVFSFMMWGLIVW
mgnify:CR=1 FL=1